MTMVSLPNILFNIEGEREWYEDDTILVDKNGLSGTVTAVGTGVFNTDTILVDKDGLSGTTTDV